MREYLHFSLFFFEHRNILHCHDRKFVKLFIRLHADAIDCKYRYHYFVVGIHKRRTQKCTIAFLFFFFAGKETIAKCYDDLRSIDFRPTPLSTVSSIGPRARTEDVQENSKRPIVPFKNRGQRQKHTEFHRKLCFRRIKWNRVECDAWKTGACLY